METFLTNNEKQAIKVLNFIATYDGVITSNQEIIYLLERGIEEFIPESRRHLVRISEYYPIQIKFVKQRSHV